jgi:UTP:GlnB (protein PII) uridylyltransferase
LLADLASVFRAAGVTIRAATAGGSEGRAYDTFELSRTDGRKLDAATEDQIRHLAATGLSVRRRRFRAPDLVAAQ